MIIGNPSAKIEYPDYWILTVSVDGFPSISTLDEQIVEEIYHRRGHGLNRTSLVKTILKLFNEGYIFTFKLNSIHDEVRQKWEPSLSNITEILNGDESVYYGMTDLGASTWETMSRPAWDLYATGGRYIDDPEFEATSSNRLLLEKLLVREDFVEHIIPSSIMWTNERPWKVFYWKTLPEAWTLRLSTKSLLPDNNSDLLFANDDWYTNPFEV